MKKVFIYFVIALVSVGIIGTAFYLFAQSNNQSSETGQTGSLPTTAGIGTAFNQNGSSPSSSIFNSSASSASAKSLTISTPNISVLDYFVSNNVTIVVSPDGTIATITNNNADNISSSKIKNIISTGFSYDGTKILINFGDRQSPQTSIFDMKTKTWTPLVVGMISPQWSPSDYRIMYLKNNSNGTEALTTLDASKTKNNVVIVTTLHVQDLSLLWRTKNDVLLYDNPSVYSFGSIWSFNLQKKSLNPVINDQRGMEALWSTATTTIGLLFTGDSSQYGGSLRFIDESGSILQRFGFLTMPGKCLFSQYNATPSTVATNTSLARPATSTTSLPATTASSSSYLALYCGVPRDQNMISSARLPDDYEQMSFFTSDNIYRINTSNGSVTTLFNDQNQTMDVSRIKVFNNALFFVNRYDQKLYSIKL